MSRFVLFMMFFGGFMLVRIVSLLLIFFLFLKLWGIMKVF